MLRSTPSDELSIETLRAIRFAQLARLLISESCKYPAAAPEFYAKLLSNLATVPDLAIEKAALPFFQNKMSAPDAQTALTFFSSAEGRAISAKLAGTQPPQLTDTEESALSHFKDSPQGTALQEFLGNPQVLPAVVQAITSYAP
jgi:hypothetical protein